MMNLQRRSLLPDIECIFGVNVFDARNIKEKFASSHKRFCQLAEVYEIKNKKTPKIFLIIKNILYNKHNQR